MGEVNSLQQQLFELLVEDIDFPESATNKLINSVALNLILTSLDQNKRLELYDLLGEKSYNKAFDFVLRNVPNFHSRLIERITNILEKCI